MDSDEDPYSRPPAKAGAAKPPDLGGRTPMGRVGLLVRVAFFGLLGLVVVTFLVAAYSAVAFHLDTAPRTKAIASSEAVDSVANLLVVSELFELRKDLARRIRGGRGFSESDGFRGDGTDWYEVELSPDLAEQLRANLARSALFKPAASFPLRGKSAPDWWPTTWPEGSTCSEYRLIDLILAPSGTRLWVQNHRT